ncbi:MAG TPA: CpsB/CapC family capsule biosynthesis tyrosine phosphatase [Thermoleophilaceae bacterium]|nr:CpsB/CapC family capsule biosynthesis tyrosine phosphatase [Thermoleophilaceae bacterium]
MIDLHSHLLPGIDDGAPDLEHSIDLARAAAEQGTRVLAATPHLRADFPDVRTEELPARCDEVRAALRREGIELEVVQGGEAGLVWAVHAEDDDLRAGSYGGHGTDLLLETPYGALTAAFESLVASVADRGFRLLLAHPENNPTFQKDPDRLRGLVDQGVLLQVTARSLIRPDRRKGPRPLAEALMRDGVVHVLASDAHSGYQLRPPSLGAGATAAAELVGEARARWLVEDAPAAVLAGEPLPEAPPIEGAARRGGLFARWRGR